MIDVVEFDHLEDLVHVALTRAVDENIIHFQGVHVAADIGVEDLGLHHSAVGHALVAKPGHGTDGNQIVLGMVPLASDVSDVLQGNVPDAGIEEEHAEIPRLGMPQRIALTVGKDLHVLKEEPIRRTRAAALGLFSLPVIIGRRLKIKLVLVVKKGERVYAALADPTGKTVPAACDDISVCENCGLCHLCTAQIERPSMDVDDGELESLIDEKASLKPYVDKHKQLEEEIKKKVGERERVLAGKYVVTAKIISKKEYTVAARQERRLTVSRL